jgi:hypothetical protein
MYRREHDYLERSSNILICLVGTGENKTESKKTRKGKTDKSEVEAENVTGSLNTANEQSQGQLESEAQQEKANTIPQAQDNEPSSEPALSQSSDKKEPLKSELRPEPPSSELILDHSNPEELELDKNYDNTSKTSIHNMFFDYLLEQGIDSNPDFIRFIALNVSELTRMCRLYTKDRDRLDHYIHCYKAQKIQQENPVQTTSEPDVQEILRRAQEKLNQDIKQRAEALAKEAAARV